MATQPLQPDNPDRPLIAKSAREGGPPRGPRLRVSDVRIAVIMLIGTETMFFSGLIAAYLVLRGATPAWPPADQPLLPIAVTLANTVILLASAVTMHLALRAARQGAGARLVNALMVTGLLGLLFVVIQGSEWVGLVRHGLTLESSTYGATFYTLIGCHGLHVVAAVIWLMVVLVRARTGRYSAVYHEPVVLCWMYWIFVCALWPVLFGLVYL